MCMVLRQFALPLWGVHGLLGSDLPCCHHRTRRGSDAQQHVGLLPAKAGSHDCEIDSPARGVFGCSSTLGPMPTK
jgi:hypothetical protein